MADDNVEVIDDELDEFDKIIEGEDNPEEEITEEEIEDSETGDKKETPTPGAEDKKEDEPPPVTIESLSEEIKGLTAGISKLRTRAQTAEQEKNELSSKLSQITEMLAERRAALEKPETVADELPATKGIPIKFDDDGNPYMDPEDLRKLTTEEVKALTKDVTEKVSKIEQGAQVTQAQIQTRQALTEVVQKDEAFPQAIGVLHDAYQFLDNAFQAIREETGIKGNVSLDKILETLEGSKEVVDYMAKNCPGVDIDTVVETMGPIVIAGVVNARKLSKVLGTIKQASTQTIDPNVVTDKKTTLKKLIDKPSFGSIPNQLGGPDDIVDRVTDMSLDDFMDLSDAELTKFERALRARDG